MSMFGDILGTPIKDLRGGVFVNVTSTVRDLVWHLRCDHSISCDISRGWYLHSQLVRNLHPLNAVELLPQKRPESDRYLELFNSGSSNRVHPRHESVP